MPRAEQRHWVEPPPRLPVAPARENQPDDCMTVQHGVGWVFACEESGWELAPVFDTRETAEEIGRKFLAEEPFFERIPVVRYGHPIPRKAPEAAHSIEHLRRFQQSR